MYVYIYIYIYIFICLLNFGTPLSSNSLPKSQNKLKMKLEKAVSWRCSVKKLFSNIYQNSQWNTLYHSLFFNEVTR